MPSKEHADVVVVGSGAGGAPIAFAITFFGFGHDVIKATGVLVAASVAALLVGFVVEKRLAPLPLIAGIFALVFGGLTLVFHDDRFVKMKLTFQNAAFAAALLGGLAFGKNPLKALLGEGMAILAPNANSYRRFKANSYAPVAPTWGVNNRTVSLRVPAGPPKTRHVEHRVAGADANPYLVLAVLLASAHQVDREYRVMKALDGLVPVPKMRACAPTRASSAPASTSWTIWRESLFRS